MTQREAIATWPTSRANRISVRATEALSGNRTVTLEEVELFQVLVFDPTTTSRDVTLPAAANCAGTDLTIMNLGTTTGTLVVKNSAGTAVATVGSAAANDVSGGRFVCNGTTWFGTLGA